MHMVAYQQSHLLTEPATANIDVESPPEPAPVADWDNDDACSQCDAESGISGAHDHTGEWWHLPRVLTKYGWTFPDMPAYDNVFAEPIVKTRLVDGRCAWCRERG